MNDDEISTAVTRGSLVYVYNKKGQQISTIGLGAKDSLIGFTSGSVSIKRSSLIFVYNAKGQQISTISA